MRLKFDIFSVPPVYSFYALFFALALLLANELFLDSAAVTIVITLASIFPLYILYRNSLSGMISTERLEADDEIEREYARLKDVLLKNKAMLDILWDKASRVNMGTEAQTHSLDETTKSIDGISDSIVKTVEMVQKLTPSAEKASTSIFGLLESISDISTHNNEMLEVLEKTMSDVKEMSRSVDIINENFIALRKVSENSSKGVMEIDSFSKDIEKSSLRSHEMSEDVAREAELGASAVMKTVESMLNIKKIVSQTSSVIKTLGDKSGEIGNIVSFIDTLTKRINLLALNASIIASQAGEHGKAFAVVASEMEKLASQTSSSTIEISQLIKTTQEMVSSTVQANEIGMWGVEEGVTLANKAGEVLKNIQKSSKASLDMATDILSATKEQVTMAEGVLGTIREEARNLDVAGRSIEDHVKINRSVDESAGLIVKVTQQVRNAIQLQHRSSEDVSEVIEEVLDMVDELSKLTKQQNSDSDQIKQANEIITYITGENISAMKDLSASVEELKKTMDSVAGAEVVS